MLISRSSLRREVSSATYVCLSCRLKSQSANQPTSTAAWRTTAPNDEVPGSVLCRKRHRGSGSKESETFDTPKTRRWHGSGAAGTKGVGSAKGRGTARRAYHSSRPVQQETASVTGAAPPGAPPDLSDLHAHNFLKTGGIREQLRQWQELHGQQLDAQEKVLEQANDNNPDDASNNLTRLPDPSISLREEAERDEEEQRSIAHFSRTSELDDGSDLDSRFLKPGDLVELEFPKSERESIIAVFVRRGFNASQILTMNGRWMMIPERGVQYSIPGWVSPSMVEPLLQYLPDPQSVEEVEALKEKSYLEDLSVPRAVAAPLVTRMVQFQTESQEIYRKHARALDSAHDILAHDTDLRYGSLASAATTLLKMPAAKLPVTALFTVRKALSNAGFAFNIDRRSHRLTGYLQIRSKEQCRMVEMVRSWLRDWQDDMAVRARLEGDEQGLRRHRTKRGAEHVYSFLEKARSIVHRSRKDRDPTICGSIGPSKTRRPITQTSDAVQTTTTLEFSNEDTELVRFIEAWACSNMFMGLPRMESLPPLLLQATGLYNEYDLRAPTGFLFLQELGTVMPYENRVRFDQHLLLPSSQHSKPLQLLMSTLMKMADKHDFQDSMADLRHDWGNLPVYCIDDASAHEIDDGLSIESAGEGQWWVRIHIANPTAFFSRDHALAKMARHMGESIYMPERTYMMLPRWATKRHFSLGDERPALTFSVKMDAEGRTLEHDVRSGFIRNVLRLTPSEIGTMLDEQGQETESQEIIVGGDPPPPRMPRSMMDRVTPEMKEQIKTLQRLASGRSDLRKAAGGVFFNMNGAELSVFQTHKGPGLSWDHPYRKGSRTTIGDPVLKMSTKPFSNWFAPSEGLALVLVREMMLLTCETAAKWCAERKIPAIFRGVIPKPDQPDPDEFLRNVMLPAAARDPKGEYPMHLGVRYTEMLGTTKMSTTPIRHRTLGLDHYGKVTSPLRRYGDMILHWQIEAALREEARTGKSLVTKNDKADRSFLPFSAPVLDTIMLGLQPREKLILRAKAYADQYWTAQLLFRAFHYGEATIPWTPTNESIFAYPGTVPPPTANQAEVAAPGMMTGVGRPPRPPQNYIAHVFIQSTYNAQSSGIGCMNVELNTTMTMERPEKFGLGEVQPADVWEVNIVYVDLYRRTVFVRPRRLVHRAELPPEMQSHAARVARAQ